MEDLRAAADSDGVSMNGFIVLAVAEKVAALRARGLLRNLDEQDRSTYLEQHASRSRPGQMVEILARAGTNGAVIPGDEIPNGWLPAN
jgi:hypothetical protein